jgi:hypothetical protein
VTHCFLLDTEFLNIVYRIVKFQKVTRALSVKVSLIIQVVMLKKNLSFDPTENNLRNSYCVHKNEKSTHENRTLNSSQCIIL